MAAVRFMEICVVNRRIEILFNRIVVVGYWISKLFGMLGGRTFKKNAIKIKLQLKYKVCKSVHHHNTIQTNHQPDAKIFMFIILTFIYSSTCFERFPAHHQELNDCSGSLWFYLRIVVIVVLCSWSGRPALPRTQHDCRHDTKVKPEAATTVIELLMMGGKTP